MNIKGFFTLLLALTLVIALASCNSCSGHVDADDDHKCDNCGEDYDDGDEAPASTAVTVTFNVKLDNGQALRGVSFTLTRGEKTYSLVSDENGNASISLDLGPYAIDYDYGSIPEYCAPETFGVKIDKAASVDLVISDNKPDGSAKKPFFISENETEITLAPGEELYYNFRGSNLTYVNIYVEGVVINYDGETYAYENGSATALLQPEIGVITTFSIKNVSTETITTTMELVAPLGSRDNPISISGTNAQAEIKGEEIVYYKWVANKTGVVVLNINNYPTIGASAISNINDDYKLHAKFINLTNQGAPTAGVAYKLYLTAEDGKKYYFNGAVSGNFLQTTSNINEAVGVYVENASVTDENGKTNTGYRFYFMNGETKTYIDLNTSGNLVLKDKDPVAIYDYSSEKDCWSATIGKVGYYLTYYPQNSNISMTRNLSMTITGDDGKEQTIILPIISGTVGEPNAYICVEAGDEIVISVYSESGKDLIVDFSLSLYAATGNEPVPVLIDDISVSIDADASVVFSGEVGKTVTISNEENISIIHNGTTYTADENGNISVTLTNSNSFEVVNNGDTVNGVTIEIK